MCLVSFGSRERKRKKERKRKTPPLNCAFYLQVYCALGQYGPRFAETQPTIRIFFGRSISFFFFNFIYFILSLSFFWLLIQFFYLKEKKKSKKECAHSVCTSQKSVKSVL